MARFDWFAWHRNYRTDEWIHSLSEAERWAWVAFLSYANETDFLVQKCSVTLLSPLLTVTPVTLQRMLESAIKSGRIVETESTWFVKNGEKYRVGNDRTNAERQAKYREKQKITEVESNASNGSNALRNVTCQDKDNDKTRHTENTNVFSPDLPEPKSADATWMSDIVTQWNQMATELGYPKILRLTTERKKHLATRNKEPAFDFPAIVQAFRTHKPKILSGKNGSEWKPDFDYVIRSESCYTKILEGKFASNGDSNGHVKGYQAGNLSKERKFEF